MANKKVVLAFSGGLDTSFCVKYLSQECGYDVYTAIANTGGFGPEELKSIEERAYRLGAVKHATTSPRSITRRASNTWCSGMCCATAPTPSR